MLFPIRDSIAPRITPVVNTGLIVACCLAFLYQLILGSDVERLFFAAAFIPARLFGSLPAATGIPDYGVAGNLVTILLSLAAQPQAGGVAWFAHIGGFVAGVAVRGGCGCRVAKSGRRRAT